MRRRVKATRRRARSTPRTRSVATAQNRPHELHIRIAECGESIGDHLQLAAMALALEARDTNDLSLARVLLDACAHITTVARAYERLQALDLDNEVELARTMPEIAETLWACFDGLEQAEAEAVSSPSWLAGEIAAAANELADHDIVCVHIEHDARGVRRLTVVDGADAKQGAGLQLLREFTTRFGGALESGLLPRGVSIALLLR